MGYMVDRTTVATLLKMLGYSLQANKKNLAAKPSHPDRDMQFEHIVNEAKKAFASENPVLLIFRTLSYSNINNLKSVQK
jgi:hypothetical protein